MSGWSIVIVGSGRIWAHLNAGGTQPLSMKKLTIALIIGSNPRTYSFKGHMGAGSRQQDLLGDPMMRVFTLCFEAWVNLGCDICLRVACLSISGDRPLVKTVIKPSTSPWVVCNMDETKISCLKASTSSSCEQAWLGLLWSIQRGCHMWVSQGGCKVSIWCDRCLCWSRGLIYGRVHETIYIHFLVDNKLWLYH